MSAPTLVEKLYDTEKSARPAIIAIQDAGARDVIRQLATAPLWDGQLASKYGRDLLVQMGYAARWNGVNFLTQTGYAVVDSLWGLQGLVKE